MNEPKFKYKKVDSLVYGEVKEIELIGYDTRFENEKYYFVFGLIIMMKLALQTLAIKNFLTGLK